VSFFNMIRKRTPEQLELEKKQNELSDLEEDLIRQELELANLQVELHALENKYIWTVGIYLSDLDDFIAQIAELLARRHPGSSEAQNGAVSARSRAGESARFTGQADREIQPKVRPVISEELKRLYREIAKRFHPDLALTESERAQREEVMKAVNWAYQEGDISKLQEILDRWESAPENVSGDGIGAELVRVIRKIAQVQKRLEAIEIEFSQVKESDIYQLKIKFDEAEENGTNLFDELAAQVKSKIAEVDERLDKIVQDYSSV
jgi:hypothetical protein